MTMKSDQQISEIAKRLRDFHRSDRTSQICGTLLRWIEDPLMPKAQNGRHRINPILVLFASLVMMAAITFLFFTLVQL